MVIHSPRQTLKLKLHSTRGGIYGFDEVDLDCKMAEIMARYFTTAVLSAKSTDTAILINLPGHSPERKSLLRPPAPELRLPQPPCRCLYLELHLRLQLPTGLVVLGVAYLLALPLLLGPEILLLTLLKAIGSL